MWFIYSLFLYFKSDSLYLVNKASFRSATSQTGVARTAVPPQVDPQVARAREPHATEGTAVHFLSRVDVLVLLEVAQPREAFPAVRAHVGLLA